MPTPKASSSKAALCLLGLSLSVSGAFAQGGLSAPALRAAVKTSALPVLNEAFPGQIHAADALEDAAPADPNAKDDDGTTALMRAARDGQTETVGAILAQKGVRVDEKDPMGRTALMMSALQGRTEAARLLLDAKADPNAADNDEQTALLIAATFGNTKTVQALLDGGADVNHGDKNGDTALHVALIGGRLDTVVALASAPNVKLNAANKAGSTPAVLASRLEMDADKLAALIDRGADKDLPADYNDNTGNPVKGYTPLMVAALSGNLPGVKVLVDRKANLDSSEKAGEKTALMIALGASSPKIVQALIDAGADLNKQDNGGNTALLLAVTNGQIEAATALATAKGADLNAANKAGTTPLVEAARHNGQADLIAALVDHGADKDLPGNYSDYSNTVTGYSPLMVASLNANVSGVKALLDRKANVNYQAADGKTPLSIAKGLSYNGQEIVDLLKAAGARD